MPDRNALLGRGIEAHKGGQLELAEGAYLRILRRWPRDPDALHYLGMLRFHQGDSAAAIERLRDSLASDPRNAHAWMNLGNILLTGDRVSEALEAYCRSTAIQPELADAWYNLGLCHRRRDAPQQAIDSLRRALALRPDHAESRYQLGLALKEADELDEAINEMRQALALGPGTLKVYQSLGALLYRRGRIGEAADVYRAWLEHEPDSALARHMLAAAGGREVPTRASVDFVTQVFDQFAETFDANLGQLGYQAPRLVVDALLRARQGAASLDVLDAGCGTGLCGPLIAPIKGRLAGVDLSPAMIAKARERGVYDELVVGELCAFMSAHAQQFDAVISADTLVYFGDLTSPLCAAHGALRRGGLLAFTVERQQGESSDSGYRLEPHGRYVHGREYVTSVLRTSGFEVRSLEDGVLRRERGEEVVGLIAVASAA